MSVSTHIPSRRRVGTGFIAAGALLAVVVAVGALIGVAHQGRELSGVQRTAVAAQSAAIANERGLRKANARLEAAGEKPVPIPSPGPSGAAGAPGASGPAGSPGPTGAAGATGTAGSTGPTGGTGPGGLDGKDGAAGTSGSSGSSGTAGSDGLQGPPGRDGADGADGADGQNGADGTDGQDGADGQPPQSWTFSDPLGITYRCERADPFDPGAPAYQCRPAPASTDDPPQKPEN